MLTLLAIVYAVGLLVILLVANLKGQRFNIGHLLVFILISGMVYTLIMTLISANLSRHSEIVTSIPYNRYGDVYRVRHDYKDDRYFVIAENLFDISKAQYRIYLDNDAVESYIENANDFTKYIEECVLDDN